MSPESTTIDPPSAPITSEAFADFDKQFGDGLDNPEPTTPEPVPEPAPEKPAATPEPAPEKPADKAAPKPADKPADKTSEEPNDYAAPQVAKPSELRSWANRMGQRAKKAESEISTLQSRLKTLESQPPKQAQDVSALTQELAATKKQLAEYHDRIRLLDYTKHPEYEEKFQRPYRDAVTNAYRQVKELIVSEANPEDPDNPRQRDATPADFDEIYQLPLGKATILARQKFGDAAPVVLGHRQKIRELAEAGYRAVEEQKGKGAEIEAQTKAQEAQQREGMLRMFTLAVDAYQKKVPDVFQPRDNDPEGNALLEKAKPFADSVFSGSDGLTPQQVAMRDARAYSWILAYPRLARDVKKLRADLAEATKTIETLRTSGPGKPKAGSGEIEKRAESWEQAFDKLPE